LKKNLTATFKKGLAIRIDCSWHDFEAAFIATSVLLCTVFFFPCRDDGAHAGHIPRVGV